MKSIGKMLVRPFGSGKIERPLPGKPEGTSGVASCLPCLEVRGPCHTRRVRRR